MGNLSKLCLHTITTKPWKLAVALEQYSRAGVHGISIWQDAATETGIKRSADLVRASGLEVVSYVRGGFFPHTSKQARLKAIDDNKVMIEEAAALGAPMLVLVCGAEPGQDLTESRNQIKAGIEAIIEHASQHNVKLTIEPLHPMYADTRSAVNTLMQANDIAEAIDSRWVGVVVDVYHLWWDPQLEEQIKRSQLLGNLSAFHICDWKVPTRDLLLDRGIMGEGCIPLGRIRDWVLGAGFDGYHEVEIFSDGYWQMDQQTYLNKIVHSFEKYWES